MTGDEITMGGGIPYLGDPEGTGERTEVSLVESGPGKDSASDIPFSVGLHFVSGSSDYAILGILPADLIKLGKFLVAEGERMSSFDSDVINVPALDVKNTAIRRQRFAAFRRCGLESLWNNEYADMTIDALIERVRVSLPAGLQTDRLIKNLSRPWMI